MPALALPVTPAQGATALAFTPALAFALAPALPHARFALAVAAPQPLPFGLVSALTLTNPGLAFAGAFLVPAFAPPQAAPRRFLGCFRRRQSQRGNSGGYDQDTLFHDFSLSFQVPSRSSPDMGNASGVHIAVRRRPGKSHMG